jgi:nucleoside phosphorylase
MTGKILVLTAIDDELDKGRAPAGVEVIYSGVGKVNAASAATLALLVLRPTLVINYGTAGRINETLSGLVEVAHVVQRDMMAMPLVPRGKTPYSSNLDKLSSGFAGPAGPATISSHLMIRGSTRTMSTSSTWNCSRLPMSASATRSPGARSNSSPTTPTPITGRPISRTGRICSGMR